MGKRSIIDEESLPEKKKIQKAEKNKKEKKEKKSKKKERKEKKLETVNRADSGSEDGDLQEAMTFFDTLHSKTSQNTSHNDETLARSTDDLNPLKDAGVEAVRTPTAKRASKPTPDGYVCNACKQGGHWIFDCKVYLLKKNENKGSTKKDKAAALFSKIGASEEAHNQSTLPKTKVFVQGLPFNCKQQELQKMFEDECGSVKAVNLIKFDDSERCKGMAYITFDTESGAAKSLEMTGKKMGDRWLNVAYEKPRPPGSVKKGPNIAGGSGRCFRCGQTGHSPKECTHKRICYRCRSTDHLSNACPLKKVVM